jgi:membrane protein DedA with SNARE-associated domain
MVLTGRAEEPMRQAGEAVAALYQLKTGAPLFGEMDAVTESYMRSMGPGDIRNGMVAATKATAASAVGVVASYAAGREAGKAVALRRAERKNRQHSGRSSG